MPLAAQRQWPPLNFQHILRLMRDWKWRSMSGQRMPGGFQ
jgi:hypothetical protein